MLLSCCCRVHFSALASLSVCLCVWECLWMNAIHIYRVCFRVLVVVLLCGNWRYTNIQFDVENKISLNFSGRERQTGCSLSLSLWSPVRHLAHYTTISNSSKRRKKERNSGKIARQFFISLRCGSVRFGLLSALHHPDKVFR